MKVYVCINAWCDRWFYRRLDDGRWQCSTTPDFRRPAPVTGWDPEDIAAPGHELVEWCGGVS